MEVKIGDKLKLLDTDRDGVVSKEELAAAVKLLREQLCESACFYIWPRPACE